MWEFIGPVYRDIADAVIAYMLRLFAIEILYGNYLRFSSFRVVREQPK